MKSEIYPVPKEINQLKHNFKVPNSFKIYFSHNKQENQFIVNKLARQLPEKSVSVTENIEDANILFTYELLNRFNETDDTQVSAKLRDEAYLLKIDDSKVNVKAGTAKGLFYGAVSLAQYIKNKNEVTGIEVFDYPDLDFRGISDDISRGQVSKFENFKKIIDLLAGYKMNTYMLYIEDVVKFTSFPDIGEGRGALTKDEIANIIDYAKQNFIDVIPIFQTLGHFEILLTKEKYLKYAEFKGAQCLDVTNPETYEFLEKVIDEVCEMFPGEYFHMGADETWDVGKGNSKELADSIGTAALHVMHYKKVYDIIKKHNRKVIMYGDILLRHPDILGDLPKDITVVDWHYRGWRKYPSLDQFKEVGLNVIVSPSVWNFMTTFPTYMNANPNIEYFTRDGVLHNAKGMINSNWGDTGSETIKEFIQFGYAYSGTCAWNSSETDLGMFSLHFFNDYYGIDAKDNPAMDIYQILSNPLNQMLWREVWRHPLLPPRDPAWWYPTKNFDPVGKISWIEWTMPTLIKKCEEFGKMATKNKYHGELFQYQAYLLDWYAKKLKIAFMYEDYKNNDRLYKQEFYDLISSAMDQLQNLKQMFGTIWTHYYKEDNLHLVEKRYDLMYDYLAEIRDNLKVRHLTNPELTSSFVYFPNEEGEYTPKAEFEYRYNENMVVDSVKLQLMGNTFVKMYVNDEFVGEVFARRSLSLTVDQEMVKIFDITKYIKKGENVIRFEAENFMPKQSAGVNFYMETYSGEVTQISRSNSFTKVRKPGGEWIDAVEKEYRYLISAPDLKNNRESWIER